MNLVLHTTHKHALHRYTLPSEIWLIKQFDYILRNLQTDKSPVIWIVRFNLLLVNEYRVPAWMQVQVYEQKMILKIPNRML